MLDISNRHITAYVDHNNGTKVVEASTKEFPIARHLYKTSDVAAAFNLGRVIAARCKEAGLRRVMWEHKWNRNHKKVRTTAPPPPPPPPPLKKGVLCFAGWLSGCKLQSVCKLHTTQ